MSEYTMQYGQSVIRVTKIGGGTIGRRYDGDWEVTLSVSGTVVMDDVLTTGTPKTHTEVAWLALDFADDAIEV